MRRYWLLLSFLSAVLFSSPALAGQLTYWKFDPNRNQLVFRTNEGVQPKAQLIFNPTRLVIDLPGTTLGRPTISEQFGGTIRSMRVGQFDEQTTRLVIELAPGYIIDPQQVIFKGSSPRQWSVQLPIPEQIELPPPIAQQPSSSFRPVTEPPQPPSIPENPPVATSTGESEYFSVTNNGLFVRLPGEEPQNIEAKRSSNGRYMDFYLEGISFPADLAGRTLPVNRYGVSTIEFVQFPTSPPVGRLTLNVTEDSPDWRALPSRSGGLVLLPEGGLDRVFDGNGQTSSTTGQLDRIPLPEEVTIESIELAYGGTQLLISADSQITATSRWNRQKRVFEINIANGQLARRFRGPQLTSDSPFVRVKEHDYNVLIEVQPTDFVQIGHLNRLSDRLLALDLQPLEPTQQTSTISPLPVNVPPPKSKDSPPPIWEEQNPTTTPRPTPNSRILVIIDPGHGGKDPGAIGIGGVREKDIVLPISLHLQEFLSQNGIEVRMTRGSDFFVSLEGRSVRANEAGADLFVSIHANAISLQRPDVNGLETYYFESGRSLADTIHRNVLRRISTIRDRRVRRARFYVLRKTRMPSVLVEVGFVTGNEDVYRLQDSSYRQRMAEAIGEGILEYIARAGL